MLGLRTVACLAQHYCTIVAMAFMFHALCDSVFISIGVRLSHHKDNSLLTVSGVDVGCWFAAVLNRRPKKLCLICCRTNSAVRCWRLSIVLCFGHQTLGTEPHNGYTMF